MAWMGPRLARLTRLCKQNSRSLGRHATILVVVAERLFLTAFGQLVGFSLPLLLASCGDTTPVRSGAVSAGGSALVPSARDGANERMKTSSGAAPAASAEPQAHPVFAALASSDGPRAGVDSALENGAALRHFYESLARVDAGQSHDDVTILHFGDSHTAADYETGPIRRALQARFGEGGRGFVAIGEPWKHYVQEGLRNGSSHDWSPERSHPTKASKGRLVGDGQYGLAGVAIHTSSVGARAWGDFTAKASSLELAFLQQPTGGTFDVYIDGTRAGHVSTRGASGSAWRAFTASDGPHRVEIDATGDGDVRVFGAILGRDQVGVVYDALGINGARVTNALAWDEAHMAEQIRHRAPDLVVLAYGTNESGDTDVPIETYERQLVDLLGRIARAAPSASCMLLGPPDRALHTHDGWGTVPRLLDIIATQRRVAQAAGCAFFDQLEAMGGPGTIAQWADESQPRAQKDRVHLTREGYAQLGGAVAADLIRGYSAWRDDNGVVAGATATADPASLPSLPPAPTTVSQ
jgi:lysophospholipase L1-like esterase